MLLHSIAFGNLKLLAPERAAPARRGRTRARASPQELGVDEAKLAAAADKLFAEGEDGLDGLATPAGRTRRAYLDAEDFARTIHCMGTSLLDWVQDLHARGALRRATRASSASPARATTSRGRATPRSRPRRSRSRRSSRSIAMEFAPHGVRCNVLQPGVTEHAGARRRSPGSEHLKALGAPAQPVRPAHHARATSPTSSICSRLDEAAWINGALIRVDGGEHVSGSTS